MEDPWTPDPDQMIEAEIVEEEEKAAATEQDVQDFARVQNDPAFAVEVVASVNQLNSQYVENYPQRPGYIDPSTVTTHDFLDENWDPSSGVRPQRWEDMPGYEELPDLRLGQTGTEILPYGN